MEYDVLLSGKHNALACRVLNALRDFEAEYGNQIAKKKHLQPEDMYTLGCYALTADGFLIGELLFSIDDEWVLLSSGFVWPEFRGRGVYSKLMKTIENYAILNNCNGIFVSTYTFEAPHIYEHLGFTKGSVLHDMPKGNTSIDYFKELTPSESGEKE